MQVALPHLFQPRSYQHGPFEAYQRGIRRFITAWHRKAGKDLTWWNFTILRAMERQGMFWYVLPTYEQAKNVIWYGFSKEPRTADDDYGTVLQAGQRFLDHIPAALLAKEPNNSDLLITLVNGSMIKLMGSDKTDSIVGPNPIGIVLSEFAIQFPEVLDLLTPILEQNQGWLAINSTPRSQNHFYRMWQVARANPQRWFSSLLTIEDTKRDSPGENGGAAVTKDQIEQLRREGMDEDWIQQEYYCSFFGTHTGAYYGKIVGDIDQRGQIRDVPWEPEYPVFTAWDLGVADATAIWFGQICGRELHIIDYFEASGEGLPYFARELRNRPYYYSNHWAPHDIEVRELGSGKSRKEIASTLGIYFRVVPNLPLQDGIDAVRVVLNRCFFDRVKCDKGLRALRGYRKEWDAKKGDYRSYPFHDKWSHGADAFRYLALIADRESSAFAPATSVNTDFNIFQ